MLLVRVKLSSLLTSWVSPLCLNYERKEETSSIKTETICVYTSL